MADETEHEREHYGLDPHDPEAVLRSKLDEMDAQENASFRVYRQHSGNTSKMSFCFTVPADQYSFEELLEKIKAEYGAGDYRIHLRGPTEYGKNQLIANQVVSVEGPRNLNPAPQERGNDLSPVVERMMERMERMEERLAQPQSQPQQDPVELFTKMAGAMAQFNQSMPQPNAQPQGKEKSLMEQIREAKEISEFFHKESNDDGFSSMMRETLGPLIQLAQSEADRKKSGQTQPSQQSQPKERRPNPSNNGSEQTMNRSEMEQAIGPMANQVKTLLAAAQRGGDPEVYASVVLDFIPAEQYAQVYEFLSSDGCLDAIIRYVPEVEQYREWFDGLRIAIIGELDVPGEDDDTSAHVDGSDQSGAGDGDGDTGGPAAGSRGHSQDVADHEPHGHGGEVPSSGP